MVYQSEKLIRDNKDKIGADDIKPLQTAIDDAKKVLANTAAKAEEFKTSLDTLTAASHAVSGKLYEKTKASGEGGAGAGGEAGGGGAGPGGTSGAGGAEGKAEGEDVIDADYKDVN